ncbi:hypothetical protein BABINDRAFT_163328 [Babjeviella inositovora NRRL Y-12698]|uniref:aminodeoxychorismate synthase n=1 Tax=Babjeviella inositovora NRRL Y-12698 TaxID=984486 RepID=A0A1E3QIX6_9ASCO|nr:uncharacterized protein BABINDRAFT_163328 [Babjeviella inositovora NRRL Y-12698]ODQ77600.1 hypothetical protein BABINDRAFT_163328 [Babjeviella inositovora NRRL Y-12698]
MPILLVDSYDSFTFNLKSLIETATGAAVYTIHNDSLSGDSLSNYLELFDAVVVGPGPGHPANPADVGCLPALFRMASPVPILGICLGFQSLCLENGNVVDQLEAIKHGQIYHVHEYGSDLLFAGIGPGFKSVRYHSLHASLTNDSIIPLAYCLEDESDAASRKVLMAGKHRSRPHWGVQYHPESICSESGRELVANFYALAQEWNTANGRELVNETAKLAAFSAILFQPKPLIESFETGEKSIKVREFSLPRSPIETCEAFQGKNQDFILLNSALAPGSWSIVGLPERGESPVITHSTEAKNVVQVSKWGAEGSSAYECNSIFEYIASFMEDKFVPNTATTNPHHLPFLGGLMGVFLYEEGQFMAFEKLEKTTRGPIPDTKLVFVERTVLHNVESGKYYIVSIKEDDREWMEETVQWLQSEAFGESAKSPGGSSGAVNGSVSSLCPNGPSDITISTPDKSEYLSAFAKCQSYLHSGDSYELCLTTPTTIRLPKSVSPWDIYKVLTRKNPSPYSCFMNFPDCTLILSSPERFVSWQHNDKVQLRPIKGTVKKTAEMDTVEKASTILYTPKEIGENLMIVDLIRHDLFGMLAQVDVTKLMQIEEYQTVFQLVSVIEGKLSGGVYRGIDVLANSLPPGSMTGAPKKRSVELLHLIERQKRRGLYSGVCGYWSVTDDGDWSVVIRSVFNYADDLADDGETRTWRIGAGGAITVLSTAEGEWEEMEIKLASALQAFT